MLLNRYTIEACFLSSAFRIHSTFAFFLSCLASFLLVLTLEFLRRTQRDLDRFLRARNARIQDEEHDLPEEAEEKLLPTPSTMEVVSDKLKRRPLRVVGEQLLRGLVQLSSSLSAIVSCCRSCIAIVRSIHVLQTRRQLYLKFCRVHHYLYSFGATGGLRSFHQRHAILPKK